MRVAPYFFERLLCERIRSVRPSYDQPKQTGQQVGGSSPQYHAEAAYVLRARPIPALAQQPCGGVRSSRCVHAIRGGCTIFPARRVRRRLCHLIARHVDVATALRRAATAWTTKEYALKYFRVFWATRHHNINNLFKPIEAAYVYPSCFLQGRGGANCLGLLQLRMRTSFGVGCCDRESSSKLLAR